MRAWYLWPHGWVALWEWPWSSWWCLLQSDSYVHINAKYIVFLLHSGLFVLEALCVHVRDSFCSPSCSVVLSIMNCHHAALGPRPCHHIGLTQQLYFLPSSSFSNKHISLTQKANHRAPLSCQLSFVSCWHPVRHFGGPTGPFCVSECYLEKCSSCFISSTWLSSCWNNNNVFIVYEGLITVNLVQMMGTAETADGCIPSFITRWLNTICWGVRMERKTRGQRAGRPFIRDLVKKCQTNLSAMLSHVNASPSFSLWARHETEHSLKNKNFISSPQPSPLHNMKAAGVTVKAQLKHIYQ